MTFPISLVDGQLNLDFSGTAAKINSLVITRLPARTAGAKPTAFLAGDSTVQTYDPGFAPQAGWGQMLGRFLSRRRARREQGDRRPELEELHQPGSAGRDPADDPAC